MMNTNTHDDQSPNQEAALPAAASSTDHGCSMTSSCTCTCDTKASGETESTEDLQNTRKPIVPRKKKDPEELARARARRRAARQIPTEITEDPELKRAMSVLPSNYNFEIAKTVWKIKQSKSKIVALQFPEGLLMFASTIADILERFTNAKMLIMGDVTYGACCVDDLSARNLGAGFMVHYGHSCLIPIDQTTVNMLYVFVDISFDTSHLAYLIRENFPTNSKLALLGTIQFASAMHSLKTTLEDYPNLFIPQTKPLSPGEVLGCTSPRLPDTDAIIFVADGRFHLESVMIHNPDIPAYRYNPHDKKMTREYYETDRMKGDRKSAIETAKHGNTFGLILGTLGRQGNVNIMRRLKEKLQKRGKRYIVVLLSEIYPQKLQLFRRVDAWIQIACPRLSVDWGYAFDQPILTPYEAEVALEFEAWKQVYPMDYYAKEGGSWTNYYTEDKSQQPGTVGIHQINAK